MRIVSHRKLKEFYETKGREDSRVALERWYDVVEKAGKSTFIRDKGRLSRHGLRGKSTLRFQYQGKQLQTGSCYKIHDRIRFHSFWRNSRGIR